MEKKLTVAQRTTWVGRPRFKAIFGYKTFIIFDKMIPRKFRWLIGI
jgi:hypothetical protein